MNKDIKIDDCFKQKDCDITYSDNASGAVYPVHHLEVQVHPKGGNLRKQKCPYCQNPTFENENEIVLGEDFGGCKSTQFRLMYDKHMKEHLISCDIEYTEYNSGEQDTYYGESKSIKYCPMCGRKL